MSKSRLGFTLVELLVVIVISSILLSLIAVAAMSVISTSREAATKATIISASKAINDIRHKSWISSGKNQTGGTYGDINWNSKPELIIQHIELDRETLPQTWAEAADLLTQQGKSLIPSDPTSLTENSEVLYWVLSEFSEDDWITPAMTADSDGNGRPELIDAWGNPIRFYRWPTRLIRPDGLPPTYKPRQTSMQPMEITPIDDEDIKAVLMYVNREQAKSVVDPLDQLSLLVNSLIPDASINANDTSAETSEIEQAYYLPSTYHRPIVVSSGPDGEHGLLNPCSKADFGYWGKVGNIEAAYDDLTDR